MRRMTYFVMALALVLGFTQCKKEQPASQNDNEGVRITLTVDGGSSNSKVAVDPYAQVGYATVTFEDGDVIYVGNNGAYCGYLQYSGTQFSGTITPTSEADYLHFYFMGNKGALSEPSSVNITDQTSKYPVISYAHSTDLFDSDVHSYSANLENYCAIVKFTTTDIDADITITGMKNTVAVNFGANNAADGTGVGNNPYTPSKTGDGEITLHRVSNNERWAILLKQDEVSAATAYALQNVATKYVSTSTFTVPAIDNNMYYTNDGSGISIGLTEYVPYIDAQFTVASGRTVKFSKGNLQAVFASSGTSTCTWKFADNQYDFIGNAAANTNVGNNQVSAAGTVDLFGWVGASGSLAAYGINNSTSNTQYGSYGGEDLKNDWGNLTIEGGGNHDWRVLTIDEWRYLFNERTTTGHRYAKATVCSKAGVILLPDNWSDGTYTLSNYNDGGAGFGSNNIDATGWATLESAGCVFLPAAGYRRDTNVYIGDGNYWSSTSCSHYSAYGVEFDAGSVDLQDEELMRFYGFSVRLVF